MYYFVAPIGLPVSFVGLALLRFDKNGNIKTDREDDSGNRGISFFPTPFVEKRCNNGNTLVLLDALVSNLVLMSCKNVGLSKLPTSLSKREINHANRKNGKEGDYRYHVLVVRPAGTKPGDPREQEIGTMPRHVCRGHFAEYGPEFKHSDGTPKGLLFGKYAGRFFLPPCVKGKKENGIVEKDYEVRPIP